MSYHYPDAPALHRHGSIADAFETWLREEAYTLVEAADLLGGPNWVGRARRLAEALGAGASGATLLPDFEALHRLRPSR